jgi:PAS domain S-box-containing protein
MLGYAAADVVDRITPADISDPHELVARADALSKELGTVITPGFQSLAFKASRGIEDIYELTYIRKDGSRFPAVVSVTALRDAQNTILGYLLIGTDNTARKQVEADRRSLDQQLHESLQALQEKNAELGRALTAEILAAVEPGRDYKVMEVCGGHTHSIYKYDLDDLLPENVELVHGPGCPVCVIPMGRVDDGIAIARRVVSA